MMPRGVGRCLAFWKALEAKTYSRLGYCLSLPTPYLHLGMLHRRGNVCWSLMASIRSESVSWRESSSIGHAGSDVGRWLSTKPNAAITETLLLTQPPCLHQRSTKRLVNRLGAICRLCEWGSPMGRSLGASWLLDPHYESVPLAQLTLGHHEPRQGNVHLGCAHGQESDIACSLRLLSRADRAICSTSTKSVQRWKLRVFS